MRVSVNFLSIFGLKTLSIASSCRIVCQNDLMWKNIFSRGIFILQFFMDIPTNIKPRKSFWWCTIPVWIIVRNYVDENFLDKWTGQRPRTIFIVVLKLVSHVRYFLISFRGKISFVASTKHVMNLKINSSPYNFCLQQEKIAVCTGYFIMFTVNFIAAVKCALLLSSYLS